jgi:hypothetical protein
MKSAEALSAQILDFRAELGTCGLIRALHAGLITWAPEESTIHHRASLMQLDGALISPSYRERSCQWRPDAPHDNKHRVFVGLRPHFTAIFVAIQFIGAPLGTNFGLCM